MGTDAATPDLQTAATWLKGRIALAVRDQERRTPERARPFLHPDNPWLILVCGVLFLLSAAAWSLVAFIAQARVYWIVQEEPR